MCTATAWTEGFQSLSDDLSFQIVDYHVSSEGDPSPAKPSHLAPVSSRHRFLPLSPLRHITNEKRLPPPSSLLLPSRLLEPTQKAQSHGHGRVEKADVFPPDGDTGQSVQFNRTAPTLFPLHKAIQPTFGPVIQGDMIGMKGDPKTIKCDEHINARRWCIIASRLILRFRPLRGERLAQDLCDLINRPDRIHPIDKIWGVQHQYIISTPQSQRLP